MKKQYVVFGLGTFGTSVALALESAGCEVIVVDKSMEKVQEISDLVSYAMKADFEDPEVMKSIGARNLDGGIVAVSENLESSIMATILAKEAGIPKIIAKAHNDRYAEILRKVGADVIVNPEQGMGIRIAKGLSKANFVEWIELSKEYSIVEQKIPRSWVGKTLVDLRIRERLGLNVVGIVENGNTNVGPNPRTPLPEDCLVILIGANQSLEAFDEE